MVRIVRHLLGLQDHSPRRLERRQGVVQENQSPSRCLVVQTSDKVSTLYNKQCYLTNSKDGPPCGTCQEIRPYYFRIVCGSSIEEVVTLTLL